MKGQGDVGTNMRFTAGNNPGIRKEGMFPTQKAYSQRQGEGQPTLCCDQTKLQLPVPSVGAGRKGEAPAFIGEVMEGEKRYIFICFGFAVIQGQRHAGLFITKDLPDSQNQIGRLAQMKPIAERLQGAVVDGVTDSGVVAIPQLTIKRRESDFRLPEPAGEP